MTDRNESIKAMALHLLRLIFCPRKAMPLSEWLAPARGSCEILPVKFDPEGNRKQAPKPWGPPVESICCSRGAATFVSMTNPSV